MGALTTQPRLFAIGIALVVIGILLFILIGADIGESVPADQAAQESPGRLLSFLGGGALAVGAGLIGISMNRWTVRCERR